MKGIYLAAYRASHPGYDLVYQDINGLRDIGGDMLDVDLTPYDYIISSPPCNYWSKANHRRNVSPYSLNTRHLLPCILLKLIGLGKPFLVENVTNVPLQSSWGLFRLPLFIYKVGRHTYWSNIMFGAYCRQDKENLVHINSSKRQGGDNVHRVVENFLKCVNS